MFRERAHVGPRGDPGGSLGGGPGPKCAGQNLTSSLGFAPHICAFVCAWAAPGARADVTKSALGTGPCRRGEGGAGGQKGFVRPVGCLCGPLGVCAARCVPRWVFVRPGGPWLTEAYMNKSQIGSR